jgi:hypothetical protein
MNFFHGIIINLSQKNKSIFQRLKIIGRKHALLGWVTLYKVEIPESELEALIPVLQANMTERIFFRPLSFYIHLYRGDELIVVFKRRRFRTTTDKKAWKDIIAYAQSLGIPEKQLDFFPCRIEEETY